MLEEKKIKLKKSLPEKKECRVKIIFQCFNVSRKKENIFRPFKSIIANYFSLFFASLDFIFVTFFYLKTIKKGIAGKLIKFLEKNKCKIILEIFMKNFMFAQKYEKRFVKNPKKCKYLNIKLNKKISFIF